MNDVTAGGLLQMVAIGKQDSYLIENPEITFFKKVYKKYTHFSIEYVNIYPEQIPNFNTALEFKLNLGDAIGRCYIHIEIPSIALTDNNITDVEYITEKTNYLNYLKSQLTLYNDLYSNLKNYIELIIPLYRKLLLYTNTVNFTITKLQQLTREFNTAKISNYINRIEPNVLSKINIISYILSNDNLTNISDVLSKYYSNMKYYLQYYNKKILFYSNKQKNISNINWQYNNYLGHRILKNTILEINGQQFQKYSQHIMHIHQERMLTPGQKINYNKMIGNTSELTNYYTNSKPNVALDVPCIFWFNRELGSALPLVSLKYSPCSVVINTNSIESIVSMDNYELEYNNILRLIVLRYDIDKIDINTNLIYKDYKITSDSIIYECICINNELLKLVFETLTTIEIDRMLTLYGTYYSSEDFENTFGISCASQWILTKDNWLKSYKLLGYKVSSYYGYIDYSQYYSNFSSINISLIAESIYFNDDERIKFADTPTNYIIEDYMEDTYNILNKQTYECDLSFSGLCKDITWFYYNTDYFTFLPYDLINKQNLFLAGQDILLETVDYNYYQSLQSYQYLNDMISDGIYYKSFCLHPNKSQPSGMINMRYIKSKHYIAIFNNFMTGYLKFISRFYSIISISSGKFSVL